MNVQVKTTRFTKRAGRLRPSPAGFRASRRHDAPDTAEHRLPAIVDDGAPERRKLHGPSEDQAIYTCHCGYVFEAIVTTSVDCPHCGVGQAW